MSNDKKQTAIEWLEEQINRSYHFTFQQLNCEPLEKAIEQAKQMEKEQIEDAWRRGSYSLLDNGSGEDFDEYYNETYNQ